MARYQLTENPEIINSNELKISFPTILTVPEYDEYLRWVSEGGVPDPYVPPPTEKSDTKVNIREFQTTNTTPLVVTYPLNVGTGYFSLIEIIATQDIAPFNTAGWTKKAMVGRAGGGAVLVGQEDLHTPFKTAGANVWTAVLSVNGNNAVLTLTGSATPINWSIKSTYFRYNRDGLVNG